MLIVLWLLSVILIPTVAAVLAKRYGIIILTLTLGAVMFVCNISSIKLIQIGPITTTAGVVVFSLCFVITDVIAEFWNKESAQAAVNQVLYFLVICIMLLGLVLLWPASPKGGQLSAQFNSVVGKSPRMIMASVCNYFIVQHANIYIYTVIKKLTKDKWIWLRSNVATLAGQVLDSLIFSTLAFTGIFELRQIVSIVIGALIIKIIMSILETPILYIVRWAIKYLSTRNFQTTNSLQKP